LIGEFIVIKSDTFKAKILDEFYSRLKSTDIGIKDLVIHLKGLKFIFQRVFQNVADD
jgi:hypothetical protein